MNKKIKLTLETNLDSDYYTIKQVTNSVEWRPGDYIKRDAVERIIRGRGPVEVVINAPKR